MYYGTMVNVKSDGEHIKFITRTLHAIETIKPNSELLHKNLPM